MKTFCTATCGPCRPTQKQSNPFERRCRHVYKIHLDLGLFFMSLLKVSLLAFFSYFFQSLLIVSAVFYLNTWDSCDLELSTQWARLEAAFSCLWACSELAPAEKKMAVMQRRNRRQGIIFGAARPMRPLRDFQNGERFACTPLSLCHAEISGVWIVFYQCRWSENPWWLLCEWPALHGWFREGAHQPTG